MKYGKPSLSLTLNGVLAGLVGINGGDVTWYRLSGLYLSVPFAAW